MVNKGNKRPKPLGADAIGQLLAPLQSTLAAESAAGEFNGYHRLQARLRELRAAQLPSTAASAEQLGAGLVGEGFLASARVASALVSVLDSTLEAIAAAPTAVARAHLTRFGAHLGLFLYQLPPAARGDAGAQGPEELAGFEQLQTLLQAHVELLGRLAAPLEHLREPALAREGAEASSALVLGGREAGRASPPTLSRRRRHRHSQPSLRWLQP